MTASQLLLERVRSVVARSKGKSSDYAIAKALEVTQSEVIRIKKGTAQFGEKPSMRISEILNMGFDSIRAYINEETARTPEARQFWEKRSPRFSAKIGLALVSVLAGSITIQGRAEAEGTVYQSSKEADSLYIMRSWHYWHVAKSSRHR